jgi:peptidoglycan/xylan/chitin deacetylase (PgdA/CDA1 family)
MRPPLGLYNADTLDALFEMDYSVILWNVDARDWESRSFSTFRANIEAGAQRIDGQASALLLLHDTVPDTQAHLDAILNIWQSRGYSFVSLDECLGGPVTSEKLSNEAISRNLYSIFAAVGLSIAIAINFVY